MSTPSTPQGPPPSSHQGQYTPQYPAAYPTGLPQQPGESQRTVTGRPAQSNRAGLISVILAGCVLLSQLVSALAQAAVIGGNTYEALGVVNIAFAIIDSLLAIGAIIAGAIGLAAKGRPKGLAGIGLGAGIATLFSVIVFSAIYPIAIQVVSAF